MKSSSLVIAFIFAFVCSDLSAQSKIDLQPSDTILSILQRNTGQSSGPLPSRLERPIHLCRAQ